jgi:toxin YoeB
MGQYLIEYTQTALQDLKKHKKAGNLKLIKKIDGLISELEEHPFIGTGKPEALKNELTGFWSRRINQKDRLIYKVEESIITVIIISAFGHYGDK